MKQDILNKLNSREKMRLEAIFSDLSRAAGYIRKSSVAVCIVDDRKVNGVAGNSLSYTNKDGIALNPVLKEVGSELCYLFNALDKMKDILYPDELRAS